MSELNESNTVVDSFVEIELINDTSFSDVREVLTRIGIASHKEKKLYQSCHIFFKRGKYYIVSFKEMFILDGKKSNFTDEDKGRRNKIIYLLKEWGLVSVKDENKIKTPIASMNSIKIIPYKDKKNWELIQKYQIGNHTIGVKNK